MGSIEIKGGQIEMTSFRFFDRGVRLSGLRFSAGSLQFLHKQLTLSRLCVLAGMIAVLLPGSKPAMAQSTFASLLGTVKDASGAVVATCAITVENTGTSA